MLRYFLCLLFIATSFSCFGQIFKRSEIDTTYIRQYPHTIKVKGIFLDRYYGLRLSEKESNSVVRLGAREQSYFGLGIMVWNLNLDLASLFPNPLEKQQLGESPGFDLQLNLYTRRWNIDGEYSNIENFSLKNTKAIEDIETDSTIINNLNVRNIGVGGTFILLPEKFSYRSSFIQTDRQLKSAGSPILSFGYTYSTLRSDSLYIPQEVGPPALDILTSTTNRIALLPGYSYNFIHKAWFLNTTGATGIEIQRTSSRVANQSDKNTQVEIVFEVKGGLGYHGDVFSAGALVEYQFSRSRLDNLRIWNNGGNLRLFAAYRFPSPKFLRKLKPKFIH